MKTNYVLGFMFGDCLDRVAVIKKNKPEWQRGKLNGIGGKIEEGESPIDAIVREFKEETGRTTRPRDWKYFLRMEGAEWRVECFCTVGDVDRLRSETEEEVEIHSVSQLMEGIHPAIQNVRWMVGLALDHLQNGPVFVEAKY